MPYMKKNRLSSVERYKQHLNVTGEWLLKSIQKGNGGSSAHFSAISMWSKPYPETTGYIVPTLLRLSSYLDDARYNHAAINVGEWLLEIQRHDGAWNGGLHPNSKPVASVFNTGQILKGMCALYDQTGDNRYLDAATKGANWLSDGVGDDGLWPTGDYQSSTTPSYYSHVAWPMLEVWSRVKKDNVRDSAERFLQRVLTRKNDNGVIAGWGFKKNAPAFTHTIAYTIRGFQESARLVDDYELYGAPMEQCLDVLIKLTELNGGRLPGELDQEWNATGRYVCLTGNAQIAICLLLLDQQNADLRLVNAAAKLVDFVCSVQSRNSVLSGIRGGVAGSYPLWGRYMIFRYPNWAAKYHCDALMLLIDRLEQELR
jgi:hypothetical protein